MTKVPVSFQVMEGCLQIVKHHGIDSLEAFGISESDYKLVTGPKPWLAVDRRRVERVLDTLLHGTVDIIGMDRFEIPVEYIAAVYATFVSPSNLMVACSWRSGAPSGDRDWETIHPDNIHRSM